LCKVTEKKLKKQIIKHLEEKECLTGEQHGLRKGRSTLTNVQEFDGRVSEILQERNGWAE